MLPGLQSGYHVPYTGVEWNLVRTMFRSDKIEDLERCRDMMAMWRSRMGSNTPIAIMCSYQVLFVEIEERKLAKDENYVGIEIIQMLHCSSIIRFINYVNEINQTSFRSKSIVNSVEAAGIPHWVVEVRHNASHANFPRLDTLRNAHAFAYKWLWDNFWTKSADEAIRLAGIAERANKDLDEEFENERSKRIQESIYNYTAWKTSKGANAVIETSIPLPLANLRRIIKYEPYSFLRVFLSENFMILSPIQFECAGIPVPTGPGWTVPFSLQKVWEPIFDYMDDINILGEAAIMLLSHLRNSEPIIDYQSAAWVALIIEANAQPDVDSFTESVWSTILYKMVACPEYFEYGLIQKVMSKLPSISDKRRQQVSRILNISLNTSVLELNDSMSVRTVEDLQKLIKKDVTQDDDLVRKAEKDFLLGCPLGLLPGQAYETLSLSIDSDLLRKWDSNASPRKGKMTKIAENEELYETIIIH